MAAEQSQQGTMSVGKLENIGYHLVVQVVAKGDKIENRILALAPYRFYLLATVKDHLKTETNFHFLELTSVVGKSNAVNYEPQLICSYGNKSVEIHFKKTSDLEDVVRHIVLSLQTTFAETDITKIINLQLEDESSMKKIVDAAEQAKALQDEPEPCGGYSRMYMCLSSYYHTAYREEVAWDIDTIYMAQNSKELNLNDFDHLDPKIFAAIIAALEHNKWFNKLYISKAKLNGDAFDAIVKVFKTSSVITECQIVGVHPAGVIQSAIQTAVNFSFKDFGANFGQALATNKHLALTKLDLSGNNLEDKGIISIASALAASNINLQTLNLSKTGMTSKGASAIGSAIKSNHQIQTSLTTLNMSENSLKGDNMSWSDFLSNPHNISHLDLSNSDCQLGMLFTALIVGCADIMEEINFSGNYFVSKKAKDYVIPTTIEAYFKAATSLKKIDLSNSKMPVEALSMIVKGLHDNVHIKDVELNLSGNEFKSAGAKVLVSRISALSSVTNLDISDNGFESDLVEIMDALTEIKGLKHLAVGQNFSRSNKNLHEILDSIGRLVNSEELQLTHLSLAGSKLKHDIAVLLDALGMNKTLRSLDISGNGMGNKGAKILAKVLFLNSTLETIFWDKNSVSSHGFRDIARALRSNYAVKFMPIPVHDAAGVLKSSTNRHLREIQELLKRNNTENNAFAEATYRLEESIMSYAIFDKLDSAIYSLEEITVKAKAAGVKYDSIKVDKLIQATRDIKQWSNKLRLEFEDNVDKALKDRLKDGVVKVAESSKTTLEAILKESSESLANKVIKQLAPDFDLKDQQEKLTTICHEKSNIEEFQIQDQVLNHVIHYSKYETSKRSLDIMSAISDVVVDVILEIYAKEISTIEEDIKKAAKTETSERESGDIALLTLPGIAAYRTRTLSAANRNERRKRPTSMADLSATEGASDEVDKGQAESEQIYTEIADAKVEGTDEGKITTEKKRGFKIKTPNIKTSNIKTNFMGFFKRSGDSKSSKQKVAEEKAVGEKQPEEEKQEEVVEASLEIHVEEGQKLDHITKTRAAGPPRRRPPTRPVLGTDEDQEANGDKKKNDGQNGEVEDEDDIYENSISMDELKAAAATTDAK
ncbi:F-actin-uncapping protein LRRC16A [Trichoplax sp. H2]|nr:F-actin-uncapping protein LRRC16A [Trichoplax sp. H2]|eukprot:RDD43208.1 F-actin-uncapping protein LRRC16A [Trichoplax sp. H2]